MMRIIIPTYRRIQTQDTWLAIHPDLRQFITFVVRPEEATDIRHLYSPSSVLILPEHIKNIQGTRQFIWDTFSKSEDYFVQLDDDIGYFGRTYPNPASDKPKFKFVYLAASLKKKSTIPGTAQEQRTMFDRLRSELKQGFGMTSPRPNWVFPRLVGYPRMTNGLVTGFCAFNAKLLRDKNIRFDRWASCGDTDAHLQVLALGIPTSYCTDYFYNIDALAENSSIRDRVIKDHKEMCDAWAPYITCRDTHRTGQLGVMSSYSIHRAKLFNAATQGI